MYIRRNSIHQFLLSIVTQTPGAGILRTLLLAASYLRIATKLTVGDNQNVYANYAYSSWTHKTLLCCFVTKLPTPATPPIELRNAPDSPSEGRNEDGVEVTIHGEAPEGITAEALV